MIRHSKTRIAGLALLLTLGAKAQASGDMDSCLWGTPDCPLSGTPYLDVNNDTRDNLIRLISAHKGFPLHLNPFPADDKISRDAWFGYHPEPWDPTAMPVPDTKETTPPPDPALKAALERVGVTTPIPVTPKDELEGRFVTNSPQAAADYINALASDDQVDPSRRKALAEARLALLAQGGQLSANKSVLKAGIQWPGSAGDWRNYLAAAEAFYKGNYPRAQDAFKKLSDSRQPWVSETARYMVMRTWLNQSAQKATDQYGLFDLKRIDAGSAGKALAAAQDYLSHYPHGRYSATTQGILRRIYWYLQRPQDQAPVYQQALEQAPNAEALTDVILETDGKLQNQNNLGGPNYMPVSGAPLLNFTQAMSWLRPEDEQITQAPAVTEASLSSMAPLLASKDYPGLADYLRQAWLFWRQHNYQAVVADISPDYAIKPNDVVGFSRQVLYGASLMALKRWPQAEEHWRKLLPKVDGERQQLIQMKLAATFIESHQLPRLLAADSPITNLRLRSLALKALADEAQLRAQVHSGRNAQERTIALHTLLVRDLLAGHYEQWLQDYALAADLQGKIDAKSFADVDLAVFNWDGKKSEAGYACPALSSIITTLAKTPHQPRALNCLGEFGRVTNVGINLTPDRGGNDAMNSLTPKELYFLPFDRQTLYQAIIADRQTGAEDRSFALYRAVRCYAPSGYNGCGGKDVTKPQRKAWFNQLKQQYPDSAWAKKLKYYW